MPPDEIRKLEYKLDRVLFLLNDDDGTKRQGLVSEVADLKTAFYSFLKQYNIDQAVKRGRNAAFTVMFGFFGTLLAFFAKFLYLILFK